MIPSPKLDDRTYQDILDEALSLIPRYAPQWTNHNPSDPGITLLELAAWMTDQLIGRLNRVPEKNYISFLNLLGIRLQPPRPATTLLQFDLAEGAGSQRIPKGVTASTPQTSDVDAIVFETIQDLQITSAKLSKCFSYFQETYSDNSAIVSGASQAAFEVFGGAQNVERFLYISDPRFEGAGEESLLKLQLSCPERGGRDLSRFLQWEYNNGTRWIEIEPANVEVERGEVCFEGPLEFAPVAVNELEGLWLRGRLSEVPEKTEDTEIDTVRACVEVVGEGIIPENAYANIGDAYLSLDLGKTFLPLGTEPRADSIVYFSCEDVLSTPGAEVAIEFLLADQRNYPVPSPSDDLVLIWEYSDGKRWRELGTTNSLGASSSPEEKRVFIDGTDAFQKSGSVVFRRPSSMSAVEVNGETLHWLRVRVDQGDYGVPGQYTLDGEQWIFKDERPLRPPAMAAVSFRYREEPHEIRHVLSFNDFEYTDFTKQARKEFSIFQPFEPNKEQSPALYLGFATKPPNEQLGLYFDMAEELGIGSVVSGESPVGTEELTKYHAILSDAWNSEQRVVWEYWDGKAWQILVCEDQTNGFTTSGFVNFVGPHDWESRTRFTEEGFWLRARLEMGGYVRIPRVQQLLTNVVEAQHVKTFADENLGSSDGSPSQRFSFLRAPLLEGEVIEVLERQQPPEGEVLASRVREATGRDEGAVWVRYERVDSFYDSQPTSRHYTLDYSSGELQFGDGRKGIIPPEFPNGIIARSYQVGGGAHGNVNAHSVTSLTRSLAYISSVTNPISATGGADRESVEEAKLRAPHTVKSRDRAVTAEDFEMLALRASTLLARAKCIADQSNTGIVTLVIIPKAENRDLRFKLLPSNEVIRYIRRYLDERRLVGTQLAVIKPRYRDVSIKVTLVRKTIGVSNELRQEIETALRMYLHPLLGGKHGTGWEFGNAVRKTELIRLIEEIPGVSGVHSLELYDEERRVHVEHVRLEDNQLPFGAEIRVVEKVREDIL